MSKQIFYSFFISIIFLGGFLRLFRLGEIPTGTYWDETAMLVDARSLVETGKDMHGNTWFQAIFPSYGDYKLPIYIWCVSFFVKILGPTATAVRLPSALAGILSIILAGLLGKQLAPSKTKQKEKQVIQLLIMLVMSLSFWDIMFSRAGFEGHLGQLLLGFAFYFATKASFSRPWFLVLAGFLGSLALFTYYSTRFAWPVVFLFILLIKLFQIKNIARQDRTQFISLVIAGLVAMGIFVTSLQLMSNSPHYQASQTFRLSSTSVLDQTSAVQTANQYRQIAKDSLFSRLAFHRHWFSLKQLLANYTQNLSFDFLFLTGDQNLRHGTGRHGLFALSFSPMLFLGFFVLLQKNRWSLLILLVWWLIALLPASVPLDVPHSLRSLNALLPLVIVLGFGLDFVLKSKFKLKKPLVFFWSVWTIFLWIEFCHYLFNVYPSTSAPSWQSGYQELAQKLLPEMDKNDQIWVNISDDRFYLWLLAQPYFSAKEIQAWPKDNNFQLPKVKNISFENFFYGDLINKKNKFILAGKKNEILVNLGNYGITNTLLEPVLDQGGIERFILVYFN